MRTARRRRFRRLRIRWEIRDGGYDPLLREIAEVAQLTGARPRTRTTAS
jgi:hypothetical protein